MEELKSLWEKRIGHFLLQEYERRVTAKYEDDHCVEYFSFSSWGMDREKITQNQLLTTCQQMLDYQTFISVCTFKMCLEYAQNTRIR